MSSSMLGVRQASDSNGFDPELPDDDIVLDLPALSGARIATRGRDIGIAVSVHHFLWTRGGGRR
jgi:hypothetical protein